MGNWRRFVRAVVLGCAFALVAPLAAVANGGSGSVGVVDTTTGIWYLREPSSGATTSFYYGNPGDYPIVGDWDCDGDETPGLYRQSDGFVYLRNSNTQGVGDIRFFFGNPGDIPLAGDFNNDGCDTVSIYRPSEGRVFIINELGKDEGGLGAAEFAYYFGNPGDKPFVGDFNNDGVDTIGLHRESTGLVYFRNSHTQGVAEFEFIYGNPGDKIIAADWANSSAGAETVGIYRPTEGKFYLNYENAAGFADEEFLYGNANMLPVAGNFGALPGGDAPPPTPPGTFADFTVSGTGNDVVSFQIPGDVPAVLDITHHGSSNFVVWSLDGSLETIDLLVNEIGLYEGRRPVHVGWFSSKELVRHLEIDADGNWSITARPMTSARELVSSLSGSGDDVLRYDGSASTLTSSHDGSSNFIILGHEANGRYNDLIVNEIGSYSGTDLMASGSAILEITADGNWTLQLP